MVALRSWAFGALEDLCVGVTEFDCDVSHFFVSKAYSLHTRNVSYESRFTMGHVTDGTDINGSLARDHLRGETVQSGDLIVVLDL